MTVAKGFGKLSYISGRITFGEGPVLHQMLKQFASLDPFHGEVVILVVVGMIVKVDKLTYIGMG